MNTISNLYLEIKGSETEISRVPFSRSPKMNIVISGLAVICGFTETTCCLAVFTRQWEHVAHCRH